MANLPSPIQELRHPILTEKSIRLYVKRDDLIHPEIMGNKWRKLKYNLLEAKRQGKKNILTLGGAFSNHIYATAAAGNEFGFKTLGVIRGEELSVESNSTLQSAHKNGMELQFIDRNTFKNHRKSPEQLQALYPDHYWLPEGGTNAQAVRGCMELVEEIDVDFDVIGVPIGTGGTFCGVLAGVNESQSVLGISSLKGDFIQGEIEKLLETFNIEKQNYLVDSSHHFGGYGKITHDLVAFINWFKATFSIQLDPIYTGKSFFGVWDMIKNDKFEKNLRIILLHTGGLQGISGINRKKEIIIQ